MLLERDEVVGDLSRLLGDATEQRGAAVLLEGAAGIGKTALLSRIAQLARDAGMRVLSAAGGELEQELPWGIVRDLLRRPVIATGLAVPAAAEGVLGLGQRAPEDGLAPLQPLAELCSELAELGPLLLSVDDAHWADDESARWLAFLASRLADLPVALVVAARPHDPRRPSALASLGARDGVRVLRLAPLSGAGVRELVRSALPDASEELCRACEEATGGNQFLTVELVRELAAADAPSPELVGDLSIEPVQRALRRRLLAAGEEAERVARAIAILGADAGAFPAAQLADLDAQAAARGADALRAAGLLDDGPAGRLAFIHPLFRLAVERSIPPAERSLAHMAAARQLHAAGEEIGRVGAQLLAVEPGGDAWVRERLVEAADAATAAGAASIAHALLVRAAAERVGGRDPQLLEALGRAALAVDPPAAVEPLRAAYHAATGSPQRVERALTLTGALQGAARFGEILPLLAPLNDELAREGADPALWWRVEGELLAQSYMDPAGGRERRERLGRAAARLSGAHPEESLVLLQVGVDEVFHGTANRARALIECAWDNGRLWDVVTRRSSPAAMWLLYGLMYANDPRRAADITEQWLRDLQPAGGGAEAIYANAALAEAQVRLGELREAEASALAAWSGAREIGRGFVAWWISIGVLAEVLVARGRAGEALELFARERLLDGPALKVWLMPATGIVRAQVLLACGETERGVEELADVDQWLRSVAPSPGAWWHVLDLTEGLLRLERDEEAVEIARRWSEETATFASPVVTGLTLLARGLAEASIDRLREAEALLASTTARAQHARALAELGGALRRANRRVDAREPLRRALDLAGRCGADGLAERVRLELVAAGARPRRLALSGVESLTAGELRVAQLAAEGLSNPQIGASLYVTRKTVEKHLSAVFAKLGIASRDELPAALRR